MRSVDTNLVVRLIVRDDPKHLAIAERSVEGGAWVSRLVLLEAIGVPGSVCRRSARQLAVIVGMLLERRDLVPQDRDVVASALGRFRLRNAPGFPDCLLLAAARKAGHLPLATFDRKLGAAIGAHRI